MQKKTEAMVVEAESAHCRLLADAMDEAGREMIRRYWRMEPAEALGQALRSSPLCWTILVDGSVAGMFGCSGGEDGTGYAWLTTAPPIEKVRLRFIRRSRQYIDRMLQRHGTLVSYAHVENRPLLAWLQWSGFRVEGREGDFLKCVLSSSPPVEKHKAKEVEASCVCRR